MTKHVIMIGRDGEEAICDVEPDGSVTWYDDMWRSQIELHGARTGPDTVVFPFDGAAFYVAVDAAFSRSSRVIIRRS